MTAPPTISYIQYFIPSDNDNEEHPNVFVVRKPPRGLTLGDVSAAFPLPGDYLFRAKSPYGKTHSEVVRERLLRGRDLRDTHVPLFLTPSPPPLSKSLDGSRFT